MSEAAPAPEPPPTDDGGEGDEEIGEGLQVAAVVGVLTQMLHHNSVHTKVAALDWILQLYNKLPVEVSQGLRIRNSSLFAALNIFFKRNADVFGSNYRYLYQLP